MLWALSEEYTAGGVSIHLVGGGGQRGKECYPEGGVSIGPENTQLQCT